MSVRIRHATSDDAPAVVALWSIVFPEYADPAHPQRDPTATIARKLAVGDGRFWIAETIGPDPPRVIGTVMSGYDGVRGWVYSLGVAPDARRLGVGGMLLEHALQELSAAGCPKVNIQVRSGNEAALAFWHARGFIADDVSSLGRRP